MYVHLLHEPPYGVRIVVANAILVKHPGPSECIWIVPGTINPTED